MNNRQLSYFVCIADLGSYRRASESLRVAQSALTRQIKNLEDELGVQLFHRHNDGITLTSAGALLLERARFILRQTDQARADVVAEGTVPSGIVAFGAPSSIARILFPRISKVYLSLYPQVQLRFHEGVGQLHQWLLNDEIDLAVLPNTRLTDARSFYLRNFTSEPVYLVGPAGHLAAGSRCTVRDIVSLPLILSAPPSTVRGWLDEVVAQDGRRLQIVVETEGLEVQKSLVEAGLGYALLPHSAVYRDFAGHALTFSLVDGWSLSRALAWRIDRPLTPAVKKMVEITEQEMQALSRLGAFGSGS